MKAFCLYVLLSLSFSAAVAQKAVLAKDESGKYVYFEIVNESGGRSGLALRATQFFQDFKKTMALKTVTGDTVFKAESKFVISKTATALSHPSGEVTYKLAVELREGRYRYLFSDFKFIPYERDRYGNFVPATVYGTPFETVPGKLNKAEWDSYIASSAEQARGLGANLKRYMAGEAQKKTAEKKVSTKW